MLAGWQKPFGNWRAWLIFRVEKKYRTPGRQGGHPERLPDRSKDTRGGDQLVFGERATNQ
jgi:hypothetical protein